jgi:transposase
MARPPISLRGLADKSYVMAIWNDVMPPKRRRLHALMLIWDAGPGETRTRLSEMLGISRRQLCRWITAFNRGGLEQLLYPPRRPLGRRRKISVEDFNNKVFPLVEAKALQGAPWSVPGVQKELAAEYNIHVRVGTLRRYLRGSGFKPTLRRPKPQQEAPWTLPWPKAYGTSLADYLEKTGQQI